MGSSDTSAAASLEAKLRTLIGGLTDAEAAALESMLGGGDHPEVTGFAQGQEAVALNPNLPPPLSLLVSNVLKTRHDTAKNSISNVR